MAGEGSRSRVATDDGARIVIHDRAPSFAAALAQLGQVVAEEAADLGDGWYPVRALVEKRAEGAGCRLLVTFQRAGARQRRGAHAARAALRSGPR